MKSLTIYNEGIKYVLKEDELRLYLHGPVCEYCGKKGAMLDMLHQACARTGSKYQNKNNKAKISPDLRWRVWERDNFTCLDCGIRRDLQIDHIIPESRGGKTTFDNLQTLCSTCNNKKVPHGKAKTN